MWTFLTTEAPLAAGREIWGIPKKLAHIEFTRENDHPMGSVERPKGLQICTGVMASHNEQREIYALAQHLRSKRWSDPNRSRDLLRAQTFL